VLSLSLLIEDWLTDKVSVSTIITIGYFMGLIFLPVTSFCYLAVLLIKRKLKVYVPLWLVMANVFFCLLLVYFIFYLNDPFYHQR
jgi:hypothetical protein